MFGMDNSELAMTDDELSRLAFMRDMEARGIPFKEVASDQPYYYQPHTPLPPFPAEADPVG